MQQSLAKELKFVRCKQRLSSQEITYVNLQVMKHLSGLRNYNSPTMGGEEGVVVIKPESLQRDGMDKWADKRQTDLGNYNQCFLSFNLEDLFGKQ